MSHGACIIILLLATASCGTHTATSTQSNVDPLTRDQGTKPVVSELAVQAQVMGMADEYSAALAEAMYLIVRGQTITPKARWLAQSFLRNGMGAAIDIASGANPNVALLDLLALASLQTWAFETHWVPEGIGEVAGRPAAERLRQAETELWSASSNLLDEGHRQTLRQLVDAWIEAHPDRSVVSLVRIRDFEDLRRLPTMSARDAASGLLADLEEATAAVEDASLLGERLLWFASRISYILGQQAELTTYRIADQPEADLLRESVASVEAMVSSVTDRVRSIDADLSAQQEEMFSRLRDERVAALEDLAAHASSERHEAISQAFDRLAAERRELLDDVAARASEMIPVMRELQQTIDSSCNLAANLTETITALDHLVARFDRDEDDTSEPLDIDALSTAAIEMSKTAEQLTVMLEQAESTAASPMLARQVALLDDVTSEVIDHAFWRGAWLIVILVAGLALLRLLPQRGRSSPAGR